MPLTCYLTKVRANVTFHQCNAKYLWCPKHAPPIFLLLLSLAPPPFQANLSESSNDILVRYVWCAFSPRRTSLSVQSSPVQSSQLFAPPLMPPSAQFNTAYFSTVVGCCPVILILVWPDDDDDNGDDEVASGCFRRLWRWRRRFLGYKSGRLRPWRHPHSTQPTREIHRARSTQTKSP